MGDHKERRRRSAERQKKSGPERPQSMNALHDTRPQSKLMARPPLVVVSIPGNPELMRIDWEATRRRAEEHYSE